MSATDIALCFGVPSQLVGVPDAQTYANVAEARLALYEETIIPHLRKMSSDLNEWLVPMFDDRLTLEFDIDSIPALSERVKRTYENVTSAVREGIMTRNEARQKIGLEPVEGADDLYISANLFPISDGEVEKPINPVNEEDLEDYDDDETDKAIALLLQEEKALSDINTTPTNSMAEEAARGLQWRKKYKRGGTTVGVARANQLMNKDNLSIDTVLRMYSFFSRHEVDKQGKGFKQGQEGYPSAGRIAWALWGGDAGFSWSTKVRNQIQREREGKAEAGSLKVGDMVSWDSSGGRARGEITKIVKEGKLPVPDTDFTLNASEDNPAALIRVYQGGEPSDVIVGHRFSHSKKSVMRLDRKRINTFRQGRINTRAEARNQLVLRNNLEKRFFKKVNTLFRKFLNVNMYLYRQYGIYEPDVATQSLNEGLLSSCTGSLQKNLPSNLPI